MKLKEARNIPYSTVMKILEELESKEVGLSQLALRVKDYVRRFNKCARGEELVKALVELGIDEATAVMIANIVPETPDEVRVIYDRKPQPLDEETIKKILDITASYCVEREE